MSTKAVILVSLILLLSTSQGSSSDRVGGSSNEMVVSSCLEKIRDSPEELRAFFLSMPKGGDIHNHLPGAVYAEGLIDRASSEGMCIYLNNYSLSKDCSMSDKTVPVSQSYRDPNLYDRLVDDWSMKESEYLNVSGHDHFFATFFAFGGATDNTSALVAELRSRAASENVDYLELMTDTEGASEASRLGSGLGWDDNLTRFYEALSSHGLKGIARNASLYLNSSDARSLEILRNRGDPGSNVTVRYLYAALRTRPKQEVFAQLALAFEVARISPLVVGINLLGPEDDWVARENYSLQMKMIDFLHGRYPDVKIALHAGELDLGLVPPEDLRFHIQEAVEVGHASRIGHGVDIMRETRSKETLSEMARSKLAVEIMPMSNEEILGVHGEDHPFPVYLSRGVPIVLASDDPGVLRTDLTEQFVIIAHTYPQVSYSDFKRFARNSLEYSFLDGEGIWASVGEYSLLRREFAGCKPGAETGAIREFLEMNDKARAEW
ncbi:MAG TPA: hypothetical protein VN455_07445, partial [Methanotrichaceae archaeon]|nr:hypothetical protein [Methanotrichaceae archaeon]